MSLSQLFKHCPSLLLSLLLATLTLAACNKTVFVEDQFPVPVMQQHPFTVQLVLDSALRDHVHSETLEDAPDWTVHFGRSNTALFEQIMRGIFTEVIVTEAADIEAAARDKAKAILQPSMLSYQLSTPSQSNTDYYEVWIKYQLSLKQADGKQLDNWEFTAYGRNKSALFAAEQALNEATRRAMRDAAAVVVLDMMKQRAFQQHFYAR